MLRMMLVPAALLLICGLARADTLEFKNGRKVAGVRVVGAQGEYVVFVKQDGKRYAVRRADLARIVRDGGAAPVSSRPAGSSGDYRDIGVEKSSGNPALDYQRLFRKPYRPGNLKQVPIAFEITATWKGDTNRKFLEAFAARVAEGSKFLWHTTEGQMYVSRVIVKDRSTGGDLRLQNLDSMKIGAPYARAFPGSHINVGGLLLAYTFTHELMHLKFNLPDEYGPRCDVCLMSANPRVTKLCVAANHSGSGKSCWDRLKQKSPLLLIPTATGPQRKLGKVPATIKVVLDR